jgi:uncharacterized protein
MYHLHQHQTWPLLSTEGPFARGCCLVHVQEPACILHLNSSNLLMACAGHSKGAGSVLLYSSKYDDIPSVVAVAGRFDMGAGIKERFGEDILERVAQEKQIEMTSKRDDCSKIQWTLTKWSLQDRLNLNNAMVTVRLSTPMHW